MPDLKSGYTFGGTIRSISVSDDVWFCQQAARVGIETFCDPTIRAGHIGSFEF